MRIPREIDSETVGGTQAGTFADEYDCQCGSEAFADFVADRDSALLDDHDRRQVPVFEIEQAERCFKQIGRVALYRERGQTVRDDEDCVVLVG